MSFISGKQVEIKKAVQPDDIKAILHERIDWEYKYGVWCTVTDVCKAIGIEPSHKNLVHAGHAIREIMPDVMERRSNSKKLILIPCRIIDEPDERELTNAHRCTIITTSAPVNAGC